MMYLAGAALTALAGLAPSVSGQRIFVTSLAPSGVYTLAWTPSESGGTLKSEGLSSQSACGFSPTWLTIDPAGGKAYCLDRSYGFPGYGVYGGVSATWTVAKDGTFDVVGLARTDGNVHGSLYGGPDSNKFIAMAGYDDSSLTTYQLPLDSDSKVLQRQHWTMSRPGPVKSKQDKPHPYSSLHDPTGKFLLVPDLGADLIRVFAIDPDFGTLTACRPVQVGEGDGPRHGAFYQSPGSNATTFYVVNELGRSVSVWSATYPPPSDSSGCGGLSLSKTQTISTAAPGASLPEAARAIELQVFGNHLYVSNAQDETMGPKQDSIVRYTIDPATGALAWGEAANSYVWCPRNFGINKAGTVLAAVGQASGNVVVIARDPQTGKLGKQLGSVKLGYGPGNAGYEDGLTSLNWWEP
ncbi:hypothetical protein PG990_013510 [Apiospora arundinis]